MSGGAPARERRSSPRHRGPPGRETAYCRTRRSGGDGLERRSPTGIARERETSPHDAAPCQRKWHTTSCCENAVAPSPHRAERRAGQGTPTSGRHARERETSAHDAAPCQRDSTTTSHTRLAREGNAGLRPASRGSAKPAPHDAAPCQRDSTTSTSHPGWRRETERRSPTGIARERETSANDAAPCRRECHTTSCCENAVAPSPQPGRAARRPGNADLRSASRGSAKPALRPA